MKFLTQSLDSPKRLFVPINEFEFAAFVVNVRHLSTRQSEPPRTAFRPILQRSKPLGFVDACGQRLI